MSDPSMPKKPHSTAKSDATAISTASKDTTIMAPPRVNERIASPPSQPQPHHFDDDLTDLSEHSQDAPTADTRNDATIPSELGYITDPMAASRKYKPGQTHMGTKYRRDKDGELAPGSIIRDRFVIKRRLGSGGMGSVYRALDLRKEEAGDNEPYIAIKLLRGNFQFHNDAFVTLQREAKKTQSLAHPNIVTVYDFDRDEDLIFITMEELEGAPLNELIKNGQIKTMPRSSKVRIIENIAKGLAYAHENDIVHSDLKPANIFITKKGDVKVLDFGIARAANQDVFQDTFDAGKLGALTYAYASLEMFLFKNPHPSDDVYALGIIAYELLYGTHPYERKDAKHVAKNKLKPLKTSEKNPFIRSLLAHSVAVNHEQRIADADIFLRKFRNSRKLPLRLSLATCILAMSVTANTLYIQSLEPAVIAFSSLPVAQQQQFSNYIEEGYKALNYGDLQGGVVNFNEAFSIHKTHKEMKKAQNKIEDILKKQMGNTKNESEQNFVLKQIQSLKKYPAFEGLQLDKKSP